MTRRHAPKRRVVDVVRSGTYPDVWWEHFLECGHLERRKRKAAGKKIGCGLCSYDRDNTVAINEEATLMSYTSDVRARLASALEVTQESVTIEARMVGGRPKVQSAMVVLGGTQVRKLAGK